MDKQLRRLTLTASERKLRKQREIDLPFQNEIKKIIQTEYIYEYTKIAKKLEIPRAKVISLIKRTPVLLNAHTKLVNDLRAIAEENIMEALLDSTHPRNWEASKLIHLEAKRQESSSHSQTINIQNNSNGDNPQPLTFKFSSNGK